MSDPDSLQRLIDASLDDPSREPEFLQALLSATLYLHITEADAVRGTKVVQFQRPDGLVVVPVFTTVERATRAAAGVVTVAAMPGHDLLQALHAHVLMFDPNDTTCTLYPEEIDALLAGTAVIAPAKFHAAGQVAAPTGDPHGIRAIAVQALERVDAVEALTLGQTGNDAWLVIAAVPDAWAERTARALALALKARVPTLPVELNFTTLEPDARPPHWYAEAKLEPFWSRPSAITTH